MKILKILVVLSIIVAIAVVGMSFYNEGTENTQTAEATLI